VAGASGSVVQRPPAGSESEGSPPAPTSRPPPVVREPAKAHSPDRKLRAASWRLASGPAGFCAAADYPYIASAADYPYIASAALLLSEPLGSKRKPLNHAGRVSEALGVS
jgi:hypothetical protein